MPAIRDLITGENQIISPLQAAELETKENLQLASRMTYGISAIAFLVGTVAVSIAIPGTTDAHIALPAIILSGVIAFILCRSFCNKIWLQPAKDKKSAMERLIYKWTHTDNPDERKKLEEELLKLSGNMVFFAMSPTDYTSKLKDLKNRETRAQTPEERQKLEEFENQLRGGLIFRMNAPIAVSLFISIIVVFYLCTHIHPFRYFDSIVHVALISLIPACVFTFFMSRKFPVWPYMTGLPDDREKPLVQLYMARMTSTLALTLLFTYFVLEFNQSLDHSITNTQTLLILDKKFTVSTDNKTGIVSENCFVYIPTPGQPPATDSTEQIQISSEDYGRVIPQQTKITIDVARGFFHIPWYNGTYIVAQSQ